MKPVYFFFNKLGYFAKDQIVIFLFFYKYELTIQNKLQTRC